MKGSLLTVQILCLELHWLTCHCCLSWVISLAGTTSQTAGGYLFGILMRMHCAQVEELPLSSTGHMQSQAISSHPLSAQTQCTPCCTCPQIVTSTHKGILEIVVLHASQYVISGSLRELSLLMQGRDTRAAQGDSA